MWLPIKPDFRSQNLPQQLPKCSIGRKTVSLTGFGWFRMKEPDGNGNFSESVPKAVSENFSEFL
jgi:hypothetical protein